MKNKISSQKKLSNKLSAKNTHTSKSKNRTTSSTQAGSSHKRNYLYTDQQELENETRLTQNARNYYYQKTAHLNTKLPYYETDESLIQDKIIELTPEQQAYKQRALLKINAMNSGYRVNSEGQILSNEQISEAVNSHTIDEGGIDADSELSEETLTSFKGFEQTRSDTVVDADDDFMYTQQISESIAIKSISDRGETLPYTKFIIENSAGNILIESCTNANGEFNRSFKIFNGEKLYLRFFSPGLSQDKIQINNNGEVK